MPKGFDVRLELLLHRKPEAAAPEVGIGVKQLSERSQDNRCLFIIHVNQIELRTLISGGSPQLARGRKN